MGRNNKKIPVTGEIRFAREMPRPIRLLCIAEPHGGCLSNDHKVEALLSVICAEPATILDAQRGGFICLDCANRNRELHWQNLEAFARHQGKRARTDTEIGLCGLRFIELEMCALFFAQHQRARSIDFQKALPRLWEQIAAMLTYQTRLSTERVLIRSDN